MTRLNVNWEGIHDSTGYLFSFAKSLSTAVKNSPWAEYSEDIIATSGFAFRMWVAADLCPSSTSIWSFDMQKPWVENGRLTCDYVGRYWGQDLIEEQKRLEAIEIIKKSIDNGIPAISWDIGIPEWGLITGYDDETKTLYTLSVANGEGEMSYDVLGKRELPLLSVLTLTGIADKSDDELLRDTMKLAAMHLKGEEWCSNAKGLEAYPALMKHFEPDMFTNENGFAWNREYLLGTYGALKYYAWKYFEKHGQTQLAELYNEIHSAWLEAFRINQTGDGCAADILNQLKSAYEKETIALEIMQKPKLVKYQIHQEEFTFLGIENIVTDSSDFGYFWDHFFKVGGYDKIIPYAIDTKPINVWYMKESGEKIYFQGLMVENVDKIPEEYTLMKFPASDFIVVTHDWVPTNDEALRFGIDFGWKNIKTLQIPDGYVRYDTPSSPITLIEKENADTPDGSRYEMWVPIRKLES